MYLFNQGLVLLLEDFEKINIAQELPEPLRLSTVELSSQPYRSMSSINDLGPRKHSMTSLTLLL